MAKLVLIDTSIWIEYLRKKDPGIFTRVNQLIDEERVVVAPFVLAELIQGAKSQKELAILQEIENVFLGLAEERDFWKRAGLLAYQIRRTGKTVPLSDCYIAIMAHYFDAMIYTLDKHFEEIKKHLKLELL